MTILFQGTGWAAIWDIIIAHQTIAALIVAWLGSNVVSALPSPDQTSGKFYKFFFTLMHGLSGSFPRVFPTLRVFNDPTQSSPSFLDDKTHSIQPVPGNVTK